MGIELLFFWVILMPVILITAGLFVGNKYMPLVWDTIFPPKETAPLPPLPEINILDEKVQAILEAREPNARLLAERKDLEQWAHYFAPRSIKHPKGVFHKSTECCYYCNDEEAI